MTPAHQERNPAFDGEDGFHRLVESIYRAAAGEVSWANPLAGLASRFDAWGVHLGGARLIDGGMTLSHEAGPGMPPLGTLDYLTRYHRIDPRAALVTALPVNQWISCHEHFDDAYVATNPFYQDFLIPHGGRYVSGAKVYQDEEIVAVLGVHRGMGSRPLSADEVALGRRLGQHLQAALDLWRRQRSTLELAFVGQAVLARLAQPVLLIDEQMRVHFSNAAATKLLGSDSRLTLNGGLLACRSPASQADLLLNVGGAAGRASPRGEHRCGAVAVRADDPSGRQAPLLLLLSRLLPAETMSAFGPDKLTMAMLHDSASRVIPDPGLLAAVYGLTPAEARVAAHIARGESLRSIAVEVGVSIHTVRSQLGVVFSKLGVRRQAELASLLTYLPAATHAFVAPSEL